MTHSKWLMIAAVLLASLVSGCADQKMIFRYAEPQQNIVWPQTDVPRLQYLGQLTGEGNFIPDPNNPKSKFIDAMKWIVGLMSTSPDPVVLQRPQSGMVGSDGRVYVTDVSRQAVYVFDRGDGRLHIWEYAEKSRRFVAPIGIAQGADGDVLVADAELGVVVRLGKDGEGKAVIGEGILVRPTGVARDPETGLIYVSDTREHKIKVFNADGTLADVFGVRGDGVMEFNAPTHLTIANRLLYVTDSLNSRIQVLSLDGDLTKEFGRRGLYVGDLPHPKGVAADRDGNIYVVESFYDHLLIYNADGEFLLPVGGTGSGVGQFYLPAGVWTDQGDRIYVADMFNGRIVVFQYLGGDAN